MKKLTIVAVVASALLGLASAGQAAPNPDQVKSFWDQMDRSRY